MQRSVFDLPGMDCPAEEQAVRLALADVNEVAELTFNLSARQLTVAHLSTDDAVLRALVPLGFGARLHGPAEPARDQDASRETQRNTALHESAVLKVLLAINATMFLSELVVGYVGNSTGLIADSLDMLADACVYAISLYVVGRGKAAQKRAASISGRFQVVLAGLVLIDVLRRTSAGSEPVAPLMIGVALIALVANVSCLALLSKHRHGGVHMKASWIFSTNDVIANCGVIVAGALVAWLNSPIPDLIIGFLIAIVVFRGGLKIVRLAKPSTSSEA